jgi:hypothetical protein
MPVPWKHIPGENMQITQVSTVGEIGRDVVHPLLLRFGIDIDEMTVFHRQLLENGVIMQKNGEIMVVLFTSCQHNDTANCAKGKGGFL